jgi:hypothetical protein
MALSTAGPPNAITTAVLMTIGRGPPVSARTPTGRHIEAVAILGSGALTAFSLLAFATGHMKAGYALGIVGALTGAVVGAVRVLGD